MVEQHKHKGLERPNGSLRLHPVSQKHKDSYAQKCHNLALANAKRTKATLKSKKPSVKAKVKDKIKDVKKLFGAESLEKKGHLVPVKDEYLYLDLTKIQNVKGVKIKFMRQEGRKKRTVGLQIDK